MNGQKHAEYEDSCRGWDEFVDDTKDYYGVDMSALRETLTRSSGSFPQHLRLGDIHPSQVLGKACVICDWDLHRVTLEDIKNLDVPFELRIHETGAGTVRGWSLCGVVRRFL